MASNYVIRAGTLFEDFETLTGWTSSGGTGGVEATALDTTPGHFTQGSSGIKLTTNGNGASNRYITKTIARTFDQDGFMQLDIYVDDVTKMTNITVYLSEDSGFVAYESQTVSASILRNGLNRVPLRRDNWTAHGGSSWSNQKIRMRFRVDSPTDNSCSVTFDNFIIGIYHRPKFIFRFDDSWADHINRAKPVMDLYGFKGSDMVISSKVGTGNYMSLANLRTLVSAGWSLHVHTDTHTDLSTLTKEQQRTEYRTCRDYLRSNGLVTGSGDLDLIFPFGGYDANTIAMMQEEGVRTGHSIISPRSTIPAIDQKLLITIDNIAQTVTLANALARVDRAISDGGCTMFLFHLLPDTAVASTEWPLADFQELCKYLYLKSPQIDVVTLNQYLTGVDLQIV